MELPEGPCWLPRQCAPRCRLGQAQAEGRAWACIKSCAQHTRVAPNPPATPAATPLAFMQQPRLKPQRAFAYLVNPLLPHSAPRRLLRHCAMLQRRRRLVHGGGRGVGGGKVQRPRLLHRHRLPRRQPRRSRIVPLWRRPGQRLPLLVRPVQLCPQGRYRAVQVGAAVRCKHSEVPRKLNPAAGRHNPLAGRPVTQPTPTRPPVPLLQLRRPAAACQTAPQPADRGPRGRPPSARQRWRAGRHIAGSAAAAAAAAAPAAVAAALLRACCACPRPRNAQGAHPL